MITKEMLAKCQNELGQAYEFLPDDVKVAIRANGPFVEYFCGSGLWGPCPKTVNCGEQHINANGTYRLSANTPVEPEQNWEEYTVGLHAGGYYVFAPKDFAMALSTAPAYPNFLGIIYEKDGEKTLRTSVDAAFGTPKRVRFLK